MRKRLDAAARWWVAHDTVLYAAFALCCTLYTASVFYGYMLFQTRDVWSAPLDDVFIHFDYARSFARGFPFHWSEGNGYSSGNTSLTYPIALALGYWIGFRGLSLMIWAALVACLSVFAFLLAGGAFVRRSVAPPNRWIRFLIPPAVLSMGALDWTLFSGMENAFHLGVWGICVFLVLRQCEAGDGRGAIHRAWWVGVGGALLTASRPESGVCVAAFAFFCAWHGHRHGHTAGYRRTLMVIVAVGLPGVLFLFGHSLANVLLTGEWAANGSVAKLATSDPFMTAADKWERYQSLLGYIVPRLVIHHFAEHNVGFLILALAVVPFASPRLRPFGLLMWGQIIAWILIVSLNNQVRWHNERYAMPAVAWLLVLAACGVGVIAGNVRSTLLQRARPARIALALIAIAVYGWAQTPRFNDQVWFFGRACRNILDQHVTAGLVLKKMNVRRVLVGDAGALIYASDRPGLDLIGLGGYHAYPFARSTRQGLGASIELIERIPAAERPDYMAIYPSWWGDLPTFFGSYLTAVPVRGNVICGGSEKVLYEADWTALDRRGRPRTILEGERIIDQLDVADLISEKNHGYNFPRPKMGFIRYHVLPDPNNHRQGLFDAGRIIPPGETEKATLRAPRGSARLIVRVAADKDLLSVVTVNGRELGRLQAPHQDGWQELALNLPDDIEGEFELGLTPEGQDATTFHVWVVAR